MQKHGGGGAASATAEGRDKPNACYLTMEDFSQGLLRVSEEREASVRKGFTSTSESCRWEELPHSPLWP